MKHTIETLKPYVEEYTTWKETQDTKLITELENDIYSSAGVYTQQEKLTFNLLKVPTEKLHLFVTQCGNEWKEHFTKEVKNLLKKQKVQFMLLLVSIDESYSFGQITSASVNIDYDIYANVIEEFEILISDNGGSLRSDPSAKGWSSFESE